MLQQRVLPHSFLFAALVAFALLMAAPGVALAANTDVSGKDVPENNSKATPEAVVTNAIGEAQSSAYASAPENAEATSLSDAETADESTCSLKSQEDKAGLSENSSATTKNESATKNEEAAQARESAVSAGAKGGQQPGGAATDANTVQAGGAGPTGSGNEQLNAQGTSKTAKRSTSITYKAKVDGAWQSAKANGGKAGATGSNSTLSSVKIEIETTEDLQGSVQYQVHADKAGWREVLVDGAKTATWQSDFIDALRVALTGDLSTAYTLTYRAYVNGVGWQDWVSDGQIAGTVGEGRALQAFQIKLLKREAPASRASAGIVGIRYRTRIGQDSWNASATNNEVSGAEGSGLQLKSFEVGVDTGAMSGRVIYRAHVAGEGWTSWTKDWSSLGLRSSIDAFKVVLKGEIATTYDVVYQAYVQGVGWQRRMRNGEIAGDAVAGLPIEALRMVLQRADHRTGWVQDENGWQFMKKGVACASVWKKTSESPIDPLLAGEHAYWLDAQGYLAVSRFVDPTSAPDAASKRAALIQSDGTAFIGKLELENGDMIITTAGGSLYTTARWVNTDRLDGTLQRYRLKPQGFYAVVQRGLFKANGKKYYGWEDGRGYVMRSLTWWVANDWYKASKSGALTNVSNKTTQHIERYVKWAIRIAKDDSHGYSQYTRWGPDYDCSSLVCASIIEAGFPNSGASWTGNMKDCLTSIGFVWHTDLSHLRRGDIMLVHADYRQHTEIYLGKGKLVGAHISEIGEIYGEPGDQTGREISVGAYYNAPWQGFLRYRG